MSVQKGHKTKEACAAAQLAYKERHEKVTAEVTVIKERGNELFQKGQLSEAFIAYKDGLSVLDDAIDAAELENAPSANDWMVLYKQLSSNMGLCLMKKEQYAQALTVLTVSLNLDKKNAKVLYRKGVCEFKLGKLSEAAGTLQKAKWWCPKGEEAEIMEAIEEVHQALSDAGMPITKGVEKLAPPKEQEVVEQHLGSSNDSSLSSRSD